MAAMSHAIHRVEAFEIVGPYTLTLRFEDGMQQRIDFRAVLAGELFGPLAGPAGVQRGGPGSGSRNGGLAQWGRLRSCHALRLAKSSGPDHCDGARLGPATTTG